MAAVDAEIQAIWRQLERVLASAKFTRSERLSRFLRFVVERHLEGRDTELKESVIALEVFGARDYDPAQDSIVRTEAGRLRARLAEYYRDEDSDSVIIELPKGGYVPTFRRVNQARPERKTRFRQLWVLLALSGVAVVLAAIGGWWVERKSGPVAIAVLPLHSLSQDPANDYFADGLTDEIIRNLSIIDGLAVRSQTSSFAFKGKPLKVREAGKQLEADYILEGSVLRSGQHLRINVQLIRARDDFPLWAGRFDRELTDVFVIQDEISRGIANSLRLKLGRGRRRYETSAEAYDLYLRARALPIQRGFWGYVDGIGPFEKAIEKDPSFAPAYAGLAAAYATRSKGYEPSERLVSDLADMRAAAEKAISLDPLLAEAHDALGMACARDGQWQQAEKSFRRAIELDAGRSMSYCNFALQLLLPLGRNIEALKQLRIAERFDPLAPEVRHDLAHALLLAGRYDESAGQCQKLPADFPGRINCLGRARLGQGRIDEAIQVLSGADVNRRKDLAELGYAYARAGRRDEAEKLAAAASPNPFQQALIFAGLGDKERTLEAVERMAPLGAVRIGLALNSPEFGLLRGDSRVRLLRKKVGLPE